MTRTSLTSILGQNTAESLAAAWNNTQAADEFKPLPTGEYECRLLSGELSESRTKGTPSYRLTFRVLDGEHAGRQLWHDVWLTPAALPMAKRDLARIGIERLEQLEEPLPAGIRCNVKVTLRREDDGTEHNRVRHFEVIGIDTPEDDAFGPFVVDPEEALI